MKNGNPARSPHSPEMLEGTSTWKHTRAGKVLETPWSLLGTSLAYWFHGEDAADIKLMGSSMNGSSGILYLYPPGCTQCNPIFQLEKESD